MFTFQESAAFLQGMSSVYDISPVDHLPMTDNNMNIVLPEISVAAAWKNVGTLMYSALDIYKQEYGE